MLISLPDVNLVFKSPNFVVRNLVSGLQATEIVTILFYIWSSSHGNLAIFTAQVGIYSWSRWNLLIFSYPIWSLSLKFLDFLPPNLILGPQETEKLTFWLLYFDLWCSTNLTSDYVYGFGYLRPYLRCPILVYEILMSEINYLLLIIH